MPIRALEGSNLYALSY